MSCQPNGRTEPGWEIGGHIQQFQWFAKGAFTCCPFLCLPSRSGDPTRRSQRRLRSLLRAWARCPSSWKALLQGDVGMWPPLRHMQDGRNDLQWIGDHRKRLSEEDVLYGYLDGFGKGAQGNQNGESWITFFLDKAVLNFCEPRNCKRGRESAS